MLAIRLPRIGIAAGRESAGGWSIAVLVLATRDPIRVGALGWGWDVEHPLRPWPRYVAREDLTGWTLSCFGVFVSWRHP